MKLVSNGRLTAFLVLQILGGHVGMSFILLNVFVARRTVKRHPVFISFCFTWMLFSLSYTLLAYGGQPMTPTPNFELCLAQAGMIHGATSMIGLSVFVFVLHTHLTLREGLKIRTPPRTPQLRVIALVIAPYIAYCVTLVAGIVVGYLQPREVYRSGYYCTFKSVAIGDVSLAFAAAAIVAALVVEILTVITLHRYWRAFQAALEVDALSISMLVRTIILLLGSVVALVTCLTFLVNVTGEIPNMVLASLPVMAFLVFGTQMDLWYAWRTKGLSAKELES